jgi:hypothetical protein
MYKLHYFVPLEAKEITKQALFDIGVGRYENYEMCCFETLGVGQFKPINKANPSVGEINILEHVQEYKIEMICDDTLINHAIEVLKTVHPYEEVAYEVFKMEQF